VAELAGSPVRPGTSDVDQSLAGRASQGDVEPYVDPGAGADDQRSKGARHTLGSDLQQ
jgi:hypothetical protein